MAQVHVEETLLREPNLWVPYKKPVNRVKVDGSNSLANGLAVCATEQGDIASNQPIVSLGQVKTTATGDGLGLDATDVSGTNSTSMIQNLKPVPFTDKATIGIHMYLDTTDSNNQIWFSYQIQSGQFRHNGIAIGKGFWSPTFILQMWLDGGVSTVNSGSSQPLQAGLGYYVITRDGTSATFYKRNSAVVGSTATPSSNNFYSSSTPAFGWGNWDGSSYTNTSTSSRILSVSIWNRILKSSEIQSLTSDPYHFLIPA